MSTKTTYAILLLVAGVFCSCGTEYNQKNSAENEGEFLNKDLQKNNLNGRVKSLHKYSVIENEARDDFFLKQNYNVKGILVREEEQKFFHYSLDVITCDSNNLPISGITNYVDKIHDNEEQIYNYLYTYNTQGLVTEYSCKSEHSQTITYFKYNKDGFETSIRTFEKGILEYVDSIVYDDKNKKIKTLMLQPDTNHFYTETVIEYSNNFKKETETNYGGFTCGTGNYPRHLIVKLDNNDNPLMLSQLRGDDTLCEMTYQYKYDIHNNWTERIALNNDTITIVNKRDIIYY